MRLSVTVFLLCSVLSVYAINTGAVLDSLDKSLEHKSEYCALRETRIKALKKLLISSENDLSKCEVSAALIDEYRGYNTDSLMVYAIKRFQISQNGDMGKFHKEAGIMNYAEALYSAGMNEEAKRYLDQISYYHDIEPELKPYYFHLYRTMYGFMADNSISDDLRRRYLETADRYRDSSIMVNRHDAFLTAINVSDKLCDRGDYAQARDTLEKIDVTSADRHSYALWCYCMARTMASAEDRELKKYYLATSAKYDIENAVRDYKALKELAMIMYEDGDYDRAYRYVMSTLEDAVACNIRVRLTDASKIFPIIEGAYHNELQARHRQLVILCVCIALVLAFLIVVLVILSKVTKRLKDSEQEIKQANQELAETIQKLNETNAKLQNTNVELSDNIKVKDEYLAQYMELCASYIDIMDRFSTKMQHISRTGDMDTLSKTLSKFSPSAEWKTFYINFDKSFLKLFPDFVEKFNSLLRDGEQILPKADGQLGTDLRVYALIRLGVTDSTKIALFLHHSVVTIYNVRVKIRNKAKCDRDLFEQLVKSL